MSSHHNVPADIKEEPHLKNQAAPNVPYFTPLQDPPAGTAFITEGKTAKDIPKLFQPLKIRSLLLQNRIFLSPLCQYSAPDGHYTAWHMAHIGGIASRGPGLVTVEATAIQANGRITPEDVGLWKDSQIAPLKEVVTFIHSQGQHAMIQIGHAGRKASTAAPWLSSGEVVGPELNGWPDDVVAPSAIQWNEDHAKPRALTLEEISQLKQDFVATTKRAIEAGFDAIEIHNAHGYLLHEFISPVSNKRTDQYGGSWENRVRLTLETVEAVRAAIPDTMPLFLRISATDWLEEQPKSDFPESWTSEDTVRLAPLLAERGVDLLDVSTGGNHPAQHPHAGPCYQAPFAKAVKDAVGDKLLVTSVGNIRTGQEANGLLEEQGLDAVFAGRWFQKDPHLVWTWAEQLGVEVQLANQIRWGFGGRGRKGGRPITDEFKGQQGKL